MSQRDNVAVVVDSAASLPEGASEYAGMHIVPMQLTIEGNTYLDGRNLTPGTFYRMLKETKKTPTTASPSPQSYLDTFQLAAEEASSILCITISPRFSSSYDSAKAAAQEAIETIPQVQITVFDSESAAGGEGLIAMEAWRAARRGAGLPEVIASAQTVMSKVSLLAFLDTLYYLWRSGRVPKVAYAGTSLLKIKPLFELTRSEVRTVARPRTSPRAEERMLEMMRARVGPGPVHATVMHADAAAAAGLLRQRIEAEFHCTELFISEFSPVMGTHTGPGLLGIAFWSEDAEQ